MSFRSRKSGGGRQKHIAGQDTGQFQFVEDGEKGGANSSTAFAVTLAFMCDFPAILLDKAGGIYGINPLPPFGICLMATIHVLKYGR